MILQNYCIPLALSLHSFCSAAAIPLQWHCNCFAVTLQKVCSIAAVSLQELCNVFAVALQKLCDVFVVAVGKPGKSLLTPKYESKMLHNFLSLIFASCFTSSPSFSNRYSPLFRLAQIRKAFQLHCLQSWVRFARQSVSLRWWKVLLQWCGSPAGCRWWIWSGISGKSFRQCDGVCLDEVAFSFFPLLQPHAHVDKDDNYKITAKARMPLPIINCLLVFSRCAMDKRFLRMVQM